MSLAMKPCFGSCGGDCCVGLVAAVADMPMLAGCCELKRPPGRFALLFANCAAVDPSGAARS